MTKSRSDVAAFLVTKTRLGRCITADLLATANLTALTGLGEIDATAAQVLYGRGAEAAEIAVIRCNDSAWLAKRVSGESRVGVLRALATNTHVPRSSLETLNRKLLGHKAYVASAFGPVWARMPINDVLASYAVAVSNQAAYYPDRKSLDTMFGGLIGRYGDLHNIRSYLTNTSFGQSAIYGLSTVLLGEGREDIGDDDIVSILVSLAGPKRVGAYEAVINASHFTERHARVFDGWNLNGAHPLAALSTSRNHYAYVADPFKGFTADREASMVLVTSSNVLSQTLLGHVTNLDDDIFDALLATGTTAGLVTQLACISDVERAVRLIGTISSDYVFDTPVTQRVLQQIELPRPQLFRMLDDPRFAAMVLHDSALTDRVKQRFEQKVTTMPGDFREICARRSGDYLAAFAHNISTCSWDRVPHEVVVEMLQQVPGLAKYVFSVSSPLADHVARYVDDMFGDDAGAGALFVSLAPTWSSTMSALVNTIRSLR